MDKGKFISIEGIDCSGKGSNLRTIIDEFNRNDVSVRVTREPGGTLFAEDLRNFIFKATAEHKNLPPLSEALLFYSARIEHCSECINPILKNGGVVITDRFYDSTLAYQCALDFDRSSGFRNHLENLHKVLMRTGLIPIPDYTLLYDIPVEVYVQRKNKRGPILGEEINGLEDRNTVYFRKVREIYLELAKKEPDRFIVVDATKPLSEVLDRSVEIINKIMSFK